MQPLTAAADVIPAARSILSRRPEGQRGAAQHGRGMHAAQQGLAARCRRTREKERAREVPPPLHAESLTRFCGGLLPLAPTLEQRASPRATKGALRLQGHGEAQEKAAVPAAAETIQNTDFGLIV